MEYFGLVQGGETTGVLYCNAFSLSRGMGGWGFRIYGYSVLVGRRWGGHPKVERLEVGIKGEHNGGRECTIRGVLL